MDKIHHGLLVFLDQLGERRAVAALHAQHQDGIRVGLDWHGAGMVTNSAPAKRFSQPRMKLEIFRAENLKLET
jgi:hypothetical protein